MKFKLNKVIALMAGAIFVCLYAQASDSIAVGNPSFDLGYNPTFPHYGVPTGWSSTVGTAGINDPSGPFFDNGNGVDGPRVGFIQNDGIISQTQTGFVPGQLYWLQGYFNARNSSDSVDLAIFHTASVSGATALLATTNITPVGSGADFYFFNLPFIAATNTGDLEIQKASHSGGDATLLFDGICIIRRDTNDVLIINPSFEASGTNQDFPGVVAPVAGWIGTGTTIVNGSSGPFWDNGTTPDGNSVLGLQNAAGVAQVLHGLIPGTSYRLTLNYNARNGNQPTAIITIDGQLAFNGVVTQAGGSTTSGNAFHSLTFDFVADSSDVYLTIQNQGVNGDTTLLVDNIRVFAPQPYAPTVSNPANVSRYADESITLSTTLSEGYPSGAKLQWLKGSSSIPDATNTTLTLANLQQSDDTNYSVMAWNSSGTNTSASAHVMVVPLPTGSTYASLVLSNNPIAYWRFNDEDGTNLHDYVSGFDVHAGIVASTLVAGPTPTAFNGFETTNTAPWLNGTNGGYLLGNVLINDSNSRDFTLAGWFYIDPTQYPFAGPDHPSGRASLFGQPSTAELGFVNGNEIYFWQQGLSAAVSVTSGFSAGAWNFIAVVSDTNLNTTTIYLNGVAQLGAVEACPGGHANYFAIGRDVAGMAGVPFAGEIDEVVFFAHSLTATQVQALYAAAQPGVATPTISLQGISPGAYQVNWSGGHLESTTNLSLGAWQTVSGAVSPYPLGTSLPVKFFRAVVP